MTDALPAGDRPQLLQKEFDGLVKACELDIAGEDQLRDLRRFFFAGALAYSSLVMQHAEGGDTVTDNDMALMEALEAELEGFGQDIAEGKA